MAKTKEESKPVVVSAEQKVVEITKDLTGFEKKQPKIAVIKSDKDLANANAFLVEVKGRVNRIKALKEEYIKPIKENIKKLESLFNDPLKSYEEIERVVKRAMGDYRLEQDRIAREEEARLKAEQEKQRKEAEKKGNPAPIVPVASVQRPESMIKSDAGKSSSRKVVKFEVTDPDALPKKYKDLVYDLAVKKGLVEQIIRPVVNLEGMKTNIAGVRVYEDFEISVSAE